MTSRRNFLKNLATGTAALSVGGIIPGVSAKSYNSILGANEKLRIGVMGVNSRGFALARGLAAEKEAIISHLCDVDTRALEKTAAMIKKNAGSEPKKFVDIRQMLMEDFDILVVATPDHWHAPAALMAMQAGKHVYLEKPTSHSPAENEILIRAAARYNKVVQVGNQRRSWTNIIKGMEEVRNGSIGEVYYGKGWYTNNRPSIGIGKVSPVPEWLNWDLWQGPAPRVKNFKDNFVHYNWHWFWHWGTGEALNNGTHFVDMLRWGMEVEYPTKVTSVGGRYFYQDDWETPDTQLIGFEFGNKKSFVWEGRSCNPKTTEGHGVGVIFYGEKGSIVMSGGNEYRVYDMKSNLIKQVDSTDGYQEGNLMGPSQYLDSLHFQNFFNGIKKGTPLNSDLLNGCISTQLVQLGNIAQRAGRSLDIDPVTGRIKNDKKAEKFWGREYEKGWEMKI
ncbi:MAG: Gfo/Idh/MocA family oxidoreductase [Paludibacter sp.]|jgi:predicted dehydrogenase|nr:Gfo/Idh/MocA family oxidoreductase [Paludibacter sp.]